MRRSAPTASTTVVGRRLCSTRRRRPRGFATRRDDSLSSGPWRPGRDGTSSRLCCGRGRSRFERATRRRVCIRSCRRRRTRARRRRRTHRLCAPCSRFCACRPTSYGEEYREQRPMFIDPPKGIVSNKKYPWALRRTVENKQQGTISLVRSENHQFGCSKYLESIFYSLKQLRK